MKRIISMMLAVMLLISVCYSTALTAAAADEPTFTVSSEQGNPGKTVSVTIRMDHNPGIASVKLKAQFDSALILNSITYNEALGGRSQQPQSMTSPVTLNWINGAANTTGDMTYAVLNFTVADNASVGMHAVTITYNQNDVYNIAEQNISFAIVNGGVNVTIPVTGLAFDHTAATVSTGDGTYTLTPIFTPSDATNKKVTWKSSNTAVATVSNGVVTLLKKGKTVITATSADGGYKATCTLTVLCSHLDCESFAAEASTCTKQGHGAYTKCKACGEIVSGSDALLPLAPHQYENRVQAKYLKSAANCASPAVYYQSCSVCGAKGTQTFTFGEVNPDNHVGSTHTENQKDASCTQEGYSGDVICDSCETVITPGSVVKKLPHTPGTAVKENEIKATCDTPGSYDEVIYCTVCKEELSRVHKDVPATGHTPGAAVKENEIKATCDTPGSYDEVIYCTVCKEELSRVHKDVPAGHTPGAAVKENEIKATCDTPGSYDEVIYCTVCKEELSRVHKDVPATGHLYDAPVWTWNGYDSAAAAFTCTVCGDKQTADAEITSSVKKEPTLTADGEREYCATVTVNGKTYTDTKSEAIPKLILLGDVDGDCVVTILDASYIQRRLAGLPNKNSFVEKASDTNGDGEFSILDATCIQMWLAGMDSNDKIGKVIA